AVAAMAATLWHGQAFSMQEGEPSPGGADWDFSSSGVFAGLKIDPDTLVKKLDLDSRSIISSRTGLLGSSSISCLSSPLGLEEKTVLSKKEKMKLRKERWLQKIESVKLAKQKQKAEAKRKATPVVGDMQPLMEALPELSDLTTGGRGRKPPKRYVTLRDGLHLSLLPNENALLELEACFGHTKKAFGLENSQEGGCLAKHPLFWLQIKAGDTINPLVTCWMPQK
uniref:F207A protein n=1 Tax=Bubo bubo TaxID=30461 RepID=A0A8C0E9V2_BUBBB